MDGVERLSLSLRRETLAQARSRGILDVSSATSPPGERFWGSERQGRFVFRATRGLAQARRARLGEMTRYNRCYTLAQARWASLSETEGLAWEN
ncbi:hypothetical protein DEO72_LG7g1880 [Vigna unguiculata]|uniref:Uncharacterized protein n=1 Tax=Vigna unguiculata TaxID=3917 RepID=A0A4D6MGK1_VIGUN|nr:hypothetical protein DEO72_LG7g1880 [Vigna unguiculata]